MTQPLTQRKCEACEGGIPPCSAETLATLADQVPLWKIQTLTDDADETGRDKALRRKFNCDDFVSAVKLLNRIAELAEAEQHHPDMNVHGYRHLTITLTTHAIGGLSENDFIVAAKIDDLLANS